MTWLNSRRKQKCSRCAAWRTSVCSTPPRGDLLCRGCALAAAANVDGQQSLNEYTR